MKDKLFNMKLSSIYKKIEDLFRPKKIVNVTVSSLASNEMLKGRCALITGGTSGIGFSIAEAFVNSGASVIITGRTQDRIDAAVAKLSKGKAFGIVLDNTQVGTFESKHTEMLEMVKKDMVTNEVVLVGYICKKPIYRQTPFGREIADVLLAVNRAYNKSDYIPTIAWGRTARFCQNLEVGTKVKIVGRVQSRMYEKKHEDGCAADCYIEGFRLIEKLSSDLIRNSSYPLLLLSLLHNSKRMEILSDDEMEKILSKVLGSDWKDYLYEYKRNLGKRYEPGQ